MVEVVQKLSEKILAATHPKNDKLCSFSKFVTVISYI